MRAAVFLAVLAAATSALIGCGRGSGGGPASVASHPGLLLQDAILSDAAAGTAQLTPQGPAVPLVDAENAPRTLLRACGNDNSADRAIDDAWQAVWDADAGNSGVISAAEIAAHYRGRDGASAISEIRRRLGCGYYVSTESFRYVLTGDLKPAAATGTDGQYAFCATTDGFTGTDCTLLLSRGPVAAALTVRALSSAAARQAIDQLRPELAVALVAATTGRQSITTSAVPPPGSSSAQLAPVTANWSLTEARQHLRAMAQEVIVYQGPVPIARDLADLGSVDAKDVPGLMEAIRFQANDYADRLRIFADNLGAGLWPASAQTAIAKLEASVRAEGPAFRSVGAARNVRTLRTRFAAAQLKARAMSGKLLAAGRALGLH